MSLAPGASLLLTRWMKTLLYEVSATHPTVFIALPSALVSIALLSCDAPARRAAQSDPLEALRADSDRFSGHGARFSGLERRV